MDTDFWLRKWARNETAFHASAANALLVKYLPALGVTPAQRVFVPLCGKSRDVHWLLAQGYRVVGVELSKIAVEQLFADLGVTPRISKVGVLVLYQAQDIDIFLGDYFALTAECVGLVDTVYDRGALVALPEDVRGPYAAHLIAVAGNAPQLLICYEYDRSLMDGPPFAFGEEEVRQHYGAHYRLEFIERAKVDGGLRPEVPAAELLWLLHKL